MKRRFENVALELINKENSTFQHTFPQCAENIRRLADSIDRVGLLSPVMLFECGGEYRTISGFRRVSACELLSIASVDAFVYKSGFFSESEAFIAGVNDNLSVRELNIVEKGIILHKLRDCFAVDEHDIIKNFMPILKLEPSKKLYLNYISLINLDNNLLKYCIQRDISIKVLSIFASILPENLQFVSDVITSLHLGGNKIKELTAIVDEIVMRDSVSVDEVNSELGIDMILRDERMTNSQKWGKIISLLKEKRYPKWTGIEKQLKHNIASLKLQKNMRFVYPQFLEGDRFTIEIDFSIEQELEDAAKELAVISKKESLSEIIKLI